MIIHNCAIDGKRRDIRIRNDRIEAIGDSFVPEDSEDLFDAGGNMAVVGFADAHMHLDKCMLAQRDPYLDTAAPEKGRRTRERKAELTEDEMYSNARGVILRAIRNGTAAIRTNVDVDPVVGLRGIKALLRLKQEFKDLLTLQVIPFAQEGVFNYPETPGLLREALTLDRDGVGGHTIIDGDGKAEAHIDIILEIAREFDVSADFHVDESGKPEHFVLPYLAQRTIDLGLQGRVNAIHACSLANVDDDAAAQAIDLCRDAGIRFIIAPTAISTRSLTRSRQLLAAGLPVNIGSDNVGDFFNPLGSAHVLHVAGILTYVHRYFTAEENQRILDMACDGGLFGLDLGQTGLEQGRRADITVLEGSNPREVMSNLGVPRLVVRNGAVLSRLDLVSSLA